MVECSYCGKQVKPLGRSMHERYCSINPNRLIKGHGGAKKGCTTWNKGKQMTQEFKDKISASLKGKATGIASSKEAEEERKLKISESMKKNPDAGGLRKGSGRGRKGRYKGYWCDSTWELAWVIYNLEHNIQFERNSKGFEYVYENETHRYYPDFIVDGVYYEIKGRRSYKSLDDKTKSKINSFDKELKVLYQNEMKPILKYVIDKYGEDFYRLYDKTK